GAGRRPRASLPHACYTSSTARMPRPRFRLWQSRCMHHLEDIYLKLLSMILHRELCDPLRMEKCLVQKLGRRPNILASSIELLDFILPLADLIWIIWINPLGLALRVAGNISQHLRIGYEVVDAVGVAIEYLAIHFRVIIHIHIDQRVRERRFIA